MVNCGHSIFWAVNCIDWFDETSGRAVLASTTYAYHAQVVDAKVALPDVKPID